MANKIDLIVKYSTEAFDEVYRLDARSALLDGNKKLMQFTGAKTVKIAKFTSDGLSDYSRANGGGYTVNGVTVDAPTGDFSGANAGTGDNWGNGNGYGYQRADMGISWEEFTLACDRGAQYRVELFDNEETAELAVGLGTKQINKQVVIPEIDAYCFSKIASYVPDMNIITETNGDTITTPIARLNEMLLKLDVAEVPAEDQIIFASPAFLQALRQSNENGLVKPLLPSDFKKNVSFLIEEYEGRPIVMVPPSRFMTDVMLKPHGYGASTTSKRIHALLVAKEAVYHIVKYNKIKVFGPEVVQDYDGYKINARIYHDVFVPDNKRVALAMYVSNANISAGSYDVGGVAVKGVTTVAGSASGTTKITGVLVTPLQLMVADALYTIEETAYSGYSTLAVGGNAPTGAGSASLVLGADLAVTASKKIKVVACKDGKVVAISDEITPVRKA